EGEADRLRTRAVRRGRRAHRHGSREAPRPALQARDLARLHFFVPFAGSSNGRTLGSGPSSLGSNPSPAASERAWKLAAFHPRRPSVSCVARLKQGSASASGLPATLTATSSFGSCARAAG